MYEDSLVINGVLYIRAYKHLWRGLVQTCHACPSQWDATTPDGKRVYIRYRWGFLTVDIDGKRVYERQIGNSLDGVMTTAEMLNYTNSLRVI